MVRRYRQMIYRKLESVITHKMAKRYGYASANGMIKDLLDKVFIIN